MSRPPITVSTCRVMPAPNAANCSAICTASSRVGVRTRANTPNGSSASFCRIGNAKAAVLPEPV